MAHVEEGAAFEGSVWRTCQCLRSVHQKTERWRRLQRAVVLNEKNNKLQQNNMMDPKYFGHDHISNIIWFDFYPVNVLMHANFASLNC